MAYTGHQKSSFDTLFSILKRTNEAIKDSQPNQGSLDGRIIKQNELTLVSLQHSDRDAIYYYIGYLIRKIIDAESDFIVLDTDVPDEGSKIVAESVPMAVDSVVNKSLEGNGAAVNSIKLLKISPLALPLSIYTTPYEESDTRSQVKPSVVILDGLNGFNLVEFSSAIIDKEKLNQISVLINTDPLVIFVTFSRLLKEAALMQLNLQLLVMYIAKDYIEETLKVIAKENDTLPCNIIVIAAQLPFQKRQVAYNHQVKIVNSVDEPGVIAVTRYPADAYEGDKEIKGLEILGAPIH